MKIVRLRALLAISLLMFGAISAYPSGPGSLDLTFAGTGYRYDLPTNPEFCTGIRAAVQPDGKIVAVAYVLLTSFTLVRYNPDGSRDTSFGTDGSVVYSGPALLPQDMVLQPDGKIVVVGRGQGSTHIGVVRYNPDGSLDTSFDGEGTVTTMIPNGTSSAAAVAMQQDGKIVITGYAYHSGEFRYYFALVRYNTNGSLDTSFDGDGIVTTLNLSAYYGSSVAIQPDGKIVTGGTSDSSGAGVFTLARYNSNGSIDTTFDGDGIVNTPMLPTGGGVVSSIVLLADGRIVAGGRNEDYDFAVVRYNSDGSLDPSFDNDGMAITPILSGDDYLNQIVVQSDGKIVAAGRADNGTNNDLVLVRYNTDGSLDSNYAAGGKAVFDLGISEGVNGITLDGTGKAIVTGGGRKFVIARITSDFAPLVEVGGRVTSTDGHGIGNAQVVLRDENNNRRYALTNPFGYYAFSGVSSNEVYVVSASAKRYRIQPLTQTITVTGAVSNVDFVGNPGSESKSAVDDDKIKEKSEGVSPPRQPASGRRYKN